MVHLSDIPSKDLKRLVLLRQKMEVLELEIETIYREALKRKKSLASQIRNAKVPRKLQPSLQQLITRILQKAGRPLTIDEILEASLAEGYQWQSRDPRNALNVKMYTDMTFRKVSPGCFTIDENQAPAPSRHPSCLRRLS